MVRDIWSMEENDEYREDEYLKRNFEKNKDLFIDSLWTEDIQSLKEKIIDNDLIMSLMLNSNYREITLERDRNDMFFLKCIIEYFSDNIKFVDLVKKHPFSDIKTIVHNWKITKYVVTEKIKIDK